MHVHYVLFLALSAVCYGCQGGESKPPAERSFDEQLKLAIEELSSGSADSAKERLDWLMDHPLPEQPNHLVFLYSIAASCAVGDTAAKARLLEDGKCMVRVLDGSQACYEEGYPLEAVRAKGMTDACFEEMCGEMFVDPEGFGKGSDDESQRAREALAFAIATCESTPPS
jgi:hypothetical protein